MAVKDWISNVYRAFQEFRVSVEFMIAEDDRVVVRNTVRGYHREAFMDMKASDRRVVLPMILIFRIENLKITEVETIYNSRVFNDELGSPVPLMKKL